jgi:hypothetical protein
MGWNFVSELRPKMDLLFILKMRYEYGEQRWNDIDKGNRRTRRESCPSATLSITNTIRTDPGSNYGLCSERPATNRLSYGTATLWINLYAAIW